MMICQSNWGYPHHFWLVISQGAPVLACAVPSSSASVLRTWQSVATVARHPWSYAAKKIRPVLLEIQRSRHLFKRHGTGPARHLFRYQPDDL